MTWLTLAKLRDRALRDALQPHGLRQLVDTPGRYPTDPGFLDHGDQGFLRGLPGFEEAREVAALAQLRHLHVQRAQPCAQAALAVAVPPGRSSVGTLVFASANDALDIGLHDQLENGFGNSPQEIALIMLLKKLGKVHGGLGHRGLRLARG